MAQYELSLSDYWRILRKRLYVVVGTLAVIVATTAFYLQRQTPVYQAEAKIKLEQSQAISAGLFGGFQSYQENPIVTESRVIESRSIAEEVVRQQHPTLAKTDPAQFQSSVDHVQGRIRAEPISETNIVRIVTTAGKAHEAAEIANLAAEAYISFNLKEKNKQARTVREFVESQLAQTETRLNESEEQLRRMRETGTATGIANVLQSRILDLQTQLANLLPKLTEAHPDIIRLREQLLKLEAQLRELPAGELEFSRLTREVQANEKAYGTLRGRLEEARIAEAEKIANASIIERAPVPGAPIHPRKRLGIAIGGLLGLLVGCILAFVVETLDTSIGTIEDVEALLGVPVLAVIPNVGREERFGPYRSIRRRLMRWAPQRLKPTPHENKMALHSHTDPHSVASEAYRILRTNIKFSPERKMVLVTSAGPGEGKSTVTSNLGIVTAQTGARTALIGADLRRPELDRIFGLQREGGLTEVLSGEVPLERAMRGLSDFILGKFGYDEAVKSPYLANLFLLTPGRLPDNPVEQVGSKVMQELLSRLRSQYDVVLVDSPPLLPVADSLMLAPSTDGVVLVYEVGRISRAALLRAKTQLESVGAKLLGVVLNHVRPEVQTQPRDYYYYRQRYAYRREGAEAPAAKQPAGTGSS